jgi:hypothetical protein
MHASEHVAADLESAASAAPPWSLGIGEAAASELVRWLAAVLPLFSGSGARSCSRISRSELRIQLETGGGIGGGNREILS